MAKRYYFRIELSAEGETAEEAWSEATVAFGDEPGACPPLEAELKEPAILGTEYTIEGEEVE